MRKTGLRRIAASALLATVVAMAPQASRPAVAAEIGPEADWCSAANALAPGAELVLRPGDYAGPCSIRTSGRPGAPIVIRAADPAARPRLVFLGSRDNVVNLAASFVTLRGLAFGPTLPDIDAIRIKQGGEEVTIEDCTFSGLGGLAIVSHSTSRRLTIRNNEIIGSNATAIYVGCHDGYSCQVTDALIEGNYIDGVEALPPQIGYGVQVKLNSTAVIRDNVIVNTKGPGIMVYGSHDTTRPSLVERNFLARSRTSSGIVVGGGPVTVRNNISVAAAEAGIGLENYGRRGLLRGVVVAHNTVHGGRKGGISAPADGPAEVKLFHNAVHSHGGMALPAPRAGIVALGNVDCRLLPCFIDPGNLDFTPLPDSPLGAQAKPGWHLTRDDYFGTPRPAVAAIGAVERATGSAVRIGRKLRPN